MLREQNGVVMKRHVVSCSWILGIMMKSISESRALCKVALAPEGPVLADALHIHVIP